MNHNHHREYTRIATTTTSPENEHRTDFSSNTTTTTHHDSPCSTETVQQHSLSSSSSATADVATAVSVSSSSATTTTIHNPLPSRTTTERIMDKCTAAIWVLVASLVFHYTNSAQVYLLTTTTGRHDENSTKPTTANLLLMQLVMIGLGINTILFGYLLLYLPYVKGLRDSTAWDVYCPRIIPCMTLIGLSIFILLIRATYPIWGFLAPFIIGIEAMGALFACHFIPIGFL